MSNKTKQDLGRIVFEMRVARKSSPGYGNNGAGTVRTVLSAPGQVTYSPYTIPGWRQRIKNNEDATTLLIGTKSSYQAIRRGQFSARALFGYGGGNTSDLVASGELFASYWWIPTSAPSTNPLAQALAAEKFLGNYYSATRSIQGSSALAELGSTVRGLASPAKALRKEVSSLYHSLSGKLYRNAGRSFKDARAVVAGTWLEWQFGIKPLVDDVNGAADAVNKLRDGDFRVVVPVRGTGVATSALLMTANAGVQAPTPPGQQGIAGNIGVVDSYRHDYTQCTIRGAVRVDSRSGEVPPAMQWGLTQEDLLPGLLEAIPWSWMYDYFFNISSVIQAWSFLSGRLAWCNRTIRNRRDHVISDIRPYPDSKWGLTYQKFSASGGACSASYTSVLRSPVAWADVAPVLRMRLPGVGSTKWANLAAVSQMYREAKKQDAEWLYLRRRNGRPRRPTW